jgi:hypothetical protein
MNLNEIRLVKHLVETAREIKSIEPGWASGNLIAFEMVMRRQERPKGAEYEVTDLQFERALRQAWMEINHVRR